MMTGAYLVLLLHARDDHLGKVYIRDVFESRRILSKWTIGSTLVNY
jgi:hypothetical protein